LAQIFTGAWQRKVAHTIHPLRRFRRSQKIQKKSGRKRKNSFTCFEGFLKKFQNFPRPQYTFVSGDFSCASIFGDLSSVVKNLAKDQLVCWYPFGSARFLFLLVLKKTALFTELPFC
jgi:hypothetical protein